MHLLRRTTCRVCGSRALTRVIDLGEQFLQGSFVKPGKEEPSRRKIPTALVHCNPMLDEQACGLLQMEHSVPPAILYAAYWYRSGTNQTMRSHLKGIVDEIQIMKSLSPGRVLDIGCNDGTLLRNYPESVEKFGVDPSDVAREVGEGITVIQDVFPTTRLSALTGAKQFDVVTSIAMFYDLEDPVGFVRGIRDILARDGLWVFEMSYMPVMLRLNSYDTICHEHLEYYSLAVVENILRRAGLKVVVASQNAINGGSIRCFATHYLNSAFDKPEYANRLQNLRQAEFDLALDTNAPYTSFQTRIEAQRDELHKLLVDLKAAGKRIHVYGASTKGNTILQWCGIDHRIVDAAADRNPDKYGAFTLGTEIPIVSEQESRSLKPDYYLVLPWHFREEFLQREQEILQSGTKFIFPLPQIEIVGS
ncbi:MAG: class I SAM-dependent methyltransferase [Bacteroidota bacterium]